jgi:hypothetical protein
LWPARAVEVRLLSAAPQNPLEIGGFFALGRNPGRGPARRLGTKWVPISPATVTGRHERAGTCRGGVSGTQGDRTCRSAGRFRLHGVADGAAASALGILAADHNRKEPTAELDLHRRPRLMASRSISSRPPAADVAAQLVADRSIAHPPQLTPAHCPELSLVLWLLLGHDREYHRGPRRCPEPKPQEGDPLAPPATLAGSGLRVLAHPALSL